MGRSVMLEHPKKVKAKISRIVTEIAIVTLGCDGHIDEIHDICDELDTVDEEVLEILEVFTIQ